MPVATRLEKAGPVLHAPSNDDRPSLAGVHERLRNLGGTTDGRLINRQTNRWPETRLKKSALEKLARRSIEPPGAEPIQAFSPRPLTIALPAVTVTFMTSSLRWLLRVAEAYRSRHSRWIFRKDASSRCFWAGRSRAIPTSLALTKARWVFLSGICIERDQSIAMLASCI
jgi:hypothetical protein